MLPPATEKVWEYLREQPALAGFVLAGGSLEFSEGGLELHDYQQIFLVNDAEKVSFFAPDNAQQRVFVRSEESHVRVTTLAELFKSKALVSAARSKTRDWLDLYVLMRDHGFTIGDYHEAFEEAGSPGQCDTGLARLCSGIPQRGDEGYLHLLKNPTTLEEMKQFFVVQREKLEVELAVEAKRRKPE